MKKNILTVYTKLIKYVSQLIEQNAAIKQNMYFSAAFIEFYCTQNVTLRKCFICNKINFKMSMNYDELLYIVM